MTKRSKAREVALQLLFQRDFNPKVKRADIETFIRDRLRGAGLQSFCLSLYDGTVEHREEIDKRLTQAAENWRLARMPAVDRNVLRLGAFELLFAADTPAAVAFDEAIELAKRFGSKDSPSFVNGVLDKLRRDATGTPPS
jgi:N utilization substance protein B